MVSTQCILLSSMLAIGQATAGQHRPERRREHHACSAVTVTQNITNAAVTVTQYVPTTIYASSEPTAVVNSTSVNSTSVSASAVVVEKVATPVYGHNTDYNDTKPIYTAVPAALPNRTEGTIDVTGVYTLPWTGSLGGSELLFDYGQYLNLTGTGYFMIRWEIGFFNNRCGVIQPPFWSGLEGKLFHVASGGGRRMDDAVNYDVPSEAPAGAKTWMGDLSPDCLITLPSGYQQMWNNEFYYLDGSVTLHENEGWADYNLGYKAVTWEQIHNDVNQKPTGGSIKRYGKVRDPGTDAAPVPQYLTRLATSNYTLVPQFFAV